MIVDIVGDVACPWRFLGKRLIDAVVASVPELAVDLHWYPFLIDPAQSPEGVDYRAYLAEKFGADEVKTGGLNQTQAQMVPPGPQALRAEAWSS